MKFHCEVGFDSMREYFMRELEKSAIRTMSFAYAEFDVFSFEHIINSILGEYFLIEAMTHMIVL